MVWREMRVTGARRGRIPRITAELVSITTGGAFIVFGLARGSLSGIAIAAIGGLMVVGGMIRLREVRGESSQSIEDQRSIAFARMVEAAKGQTKMGS